MDMSGCSPCGNADLYNKIGVGVQFNAIMPPDTKRRCVKEDDDTVFVYGKQMRRRGYRYTKQQFLAVYKIIEPNDPEKEWHDRLAKAVSRLDKSGLWPDIRQVLDNLTRMDLKDRNELRRLSMERYAVINGQWIRKPDAQTDAEYAPYAAKYPFAFTTDTNGHTHLIGDYVNELSDCRLKSMYFGTSNDRVKTELKNAVANKTPYSAHACANYDVSISYDPQTNKACYSEEYKNCGNGHYYLALDHSASVFYEND